MKKIMKSGNTTIIWNTDEAAKTPEELRAVIREIERAAAYGKSKALGFNVTAKLVKVEEQSTA